MNRTFTAIIATILLSLSEASAAAPKLTTTDGIYEFPDGRRSSSVSFCFPSGAFTYSLFWRSAKEMAIFNIGFSEGSFGHFKMIMPAYFWSPDGKTEYPLPDNYWLNDNRDGSATAQITLPAFSQNVKGVPSLFTYRFRSLEKYPQWIFLRATFTGVIPGLNFKCDAGWTDFVPPNPHGAERHIFLNGKHLLVNGPKPIPPSEKFDSFAIYATDSPKLSHDMSLLLFDPSNTDQVSLNWMTNSTLAVMFNIRLAKSCQSVPGRDGLVFALGNLPVGDGAAASEEFFKSGKDQEIRKVMQGIKWDEVIIDKSIAETALREAAELHAGQQELEAFRSALAAAELAKDYDAYFKQMRALKKFNRKLAAACVDTLLENN